MVDRGYEGLISVGSNVDPTLWIPFALNWLRARLQVLAVSTWYDAPAVGGGRGTPDFVNGAVRVRTDLPPFALRALLRHLEGLAGRRRGGDRFAPRTLDLDLMHVHPAPDPPLDWLPPADLGAEAYALVPCAQIWPDAMPAGWPEPLAAACARRFPGGGDELRPRAAP